MATADCLSDTTDSGDFVVIDDKDEQASMMSPSLSCDVNNRFDQLSDYLSRSALDQLDLSSTSPTVKTELERLHEINQKLRNSCETYATKIAGLDTHVQNQNELIRRLRVASVCSNSGDDVDRHDHETGNSTESNRPEHENESFVENSAVFFSLSQSHPPGLPEFDAAFCRESLEKIQPLMPEMSIPSELTKDSFEQFLSRFKESVNEKFEAFEGEIRQLKDENEMTKKSLSLVRDQKNVLETELLSVKSSERASHQEAHDSLKTELIELKTLRDNVSQLLDDKDLELKKMREEVNERDAKILAIRQHLNMKNEENSSMAKEVTHLRAQLTGLPKRDEVPREEQKSSTVSMRDSVEATLTENPLEPLDTFSRPFVPNPPPPPPEDEHVCPVCQMRENDSDSLNVHVQGHFSD